MALDVLEALREQVDVKFSRHVRGASGVDMTISVSDDIFDARTISDNGMTDVLGAHFGCEEKVAQEGIQALYYGLAAIQSGHNDMVLLLGHCKESQPQSRNMVTHVAFDPFFTRPVGLDFARQPGFRPRHMLKNPELRMSTWQKSWSVPEKMQPKTPAHQAFKKSAQMR